MFIFRCLLAVIALAFLPSCQTVKQAEDRPTLRLEPTQETYPIRLSRVISNVKRGTVIGQVQFGLLCIPALVDSDLMWGTGRGMIDEEEYSIAFRDEFRNSGYQVVGKHSNMFDDEQEEASRARFQIGAQIVDIKANVCFPKSGLGSGKMGGTSYTKVRWQIYDTFNRQVVYETFTEGSADVSSGVGLTFEDVLLGSFTKAARNLLADEGFRNVLIRKPEKPSSDNESRKKYSITSRDLYKSPLKHNLDKIRGQVVTVMIPNGHASAFFIGDGWALTNYHVVELSDQVGLVTITGRHIIADVVARNKRRDVALLKTEKINTSGLPLRLSEPDISDRVYVLGTPLKTELEGTLTSGIVSAIRSNNPDRKSDPLKFIQADVPTTGGNSGGPLMDENGNVIGLLSGGYDTKSDLNLFIPIADALKSLGIRYGVDSDS